MWDAHKMMHTPALSTFVLFRRAEDSFRSFHQNASYLFDERERSELAFDSGLRTVECTKHALAFPVWCVSLIQGPEIWAEMTERLCDQTLLFREMLLGSGQFEVPWTPQTNILCFRYVDSRAHDLNALQIKIREQLMVSGEFYITGTLLDGNRYLRVTVMNPATDRTHFTHLIQSILQIAERERQLPKP